MEIVIGVGIFISILLLIEGGYYLLREIRSSDKVKVRKRLKTFLSYEKSDDSAIDILRKQKLLSEIPWFNRLLSLSRWSAKINLLVEQSGIQHPAGVFFLSALLLFSGFMLGGLYTRNYLIFTSLAIFLGITPFFYIYWRKQKRMDKFQRQLPDALDLLARSLKAGHAFSGGLSMVAEEFDDPIGTEFSMTQEEIKFGVSVDDALKKLSYRVDCSDLKFFVTSVIIQRESGGNLAEILENISRLIRERFKIQGRIRVLSAEARISAVVLTALPFFIAFMISWLNPGYLRVMTTDPAGRVMIATAIIMMILGICVIRRMIKIEV